MKTILIPGFSLKNKDWAYSVANKFQSHSPVSVYNWKHWVSGKPEENWIENEAIRIAHKIDRTKVNLFAKSIGTAVTMVVLKSKKDTINKIILCGVPINDFLEGDEKYYKVLQDFPHNNIVIFQNENDNHGSLIDVQKFIKSINPNIKIVSKPRNDHEYPFSKDFETFLK